MLQCMGERRLGSSLAMPHGSSLAMPHSHSSSLAMPPPSHSNKSTLRKAAARPVRGDAGSHDIYSTFYLFNFNFYPLPFNLTLTFKLLPLVRP